MSQGRPLSLKNEAGESAPAFAIAEVSDAAPVFYTISTGTDVPADSVLTIRKPTGTGRVVAVGPCAIADDRTGGGFTGDCFVRFTGSDPSPGATLYATSGSWAVSAGGTGSPVTVAGDIRDMGSYKIVRVEIGGGSAPGGGSPTEDDDRYTCNQAVAINLTGRRVEPGHVMPVETVATGLDLTQLYPVASGGITIVDAQSRGYADNGSSVSTWTYTPSDDIQDDDLIFFAGSVSPRGTNQTALSDLWSGSDAASDFWGGTAQDDFSAMSLRFCWGDQLTDRTEIELQHYINNSAIIRVRGVKRDAFMPDISETAEQNIKSNELPGWFYFYQDNSSGVLTIVGSGTTYDYNTTYEFPAGSKVFNYLLYNGGPPRAGQDSKAEHVFTYDDTSTNENQKEFWLSDISGQAWTTPDFEQDAEFPQANGLGQVSEQYIGLVLQANLVEASFPAIPCDPLLCTELLRAAPLTANTAEAKAAARAMLDKSRYRDWVAVKTAGENGEPVTVNRRGGYAVVWANRRSLEHTHVGPPVENATRISIYPSPLPGEVGKLGRVEKNPVAAKAAADSEGAISPRTACVAGLPYVAHSDMEGWAEAIEWGREDVRQSEALTVTITATKASDSGTVMLGEWVEYELTTGAEVMLGTDWGFNRDEPVYSANQLVIDLTQDAAGVTLPSYGEPGFANTLTSTSGLFTATIYANRWLIVTVAKAAWLGDLVSIDDPQTDTFIFTDDAIDLNIPDFAPYVYANPETGEFGEVGVAIDYAAWPEAYPTPPSLVPEGTDITDVPAGYDPALGRVPGSVEGLEENDSRLGLQLCLVYISGWSSRGGDGGCC